MDNKCFELGANEQPLDIIKETCGFAGIFKQIGVIGDSLASGEFESHDEKRQHSLYRYVRVFVARCFGAHYGDEVQQLFSRRNDRARVYAKLGGCKRILAMESSVYYCVRQQRFVCVRASFGKCQGRQRRLSAG